MSAATATGFEFSSTGDQVVSRYADKVKGKTFLITGCSPKSLGGHTALALAKGHPHTLIVTGRNEAKLQPLIDQIASIAPDVRVQFLQVDLSSIADARAGAQRVLDDTSVATIDVLINSAGIMAVPFAKSVDGIEMQFAANHVGHFVFTNTLRPKLGARPRIVNLTSKGHRFGTGDFSDYNFDKGYERWRGYGQAKMANVLFATGLADRGAESYSVHPGVIHTGLGAHLTTDDLEEIPKIAKTIFPDFKPEPFKTQEQGVSTTLVAALADGLPNGAYLEDCNPTPPGAPGSDKEAANKLWELSEKLVGEKYAW